MFQWFLVHLVVFMYYCGIFVVMIINIYGSTDNKNLINEGEFDTIFNC